MTRPMVPTSDRTGTLFWLPHFLALDDKRLGPTHVLALVCLADHVDAQDRAWPGMERIGAAARCSERTARRVMAQLVEWGYVTRERREGRHGHLSTYLYTLQRPVRLSDGPADTLAEGPADSVAAAPPDIQVDGGPADTQVAGHEVPTGEPPSGEPPYPPSDPTTEHLAKRARDHRRPRSCANEDPGARTAGLALIPDVLPDTAPLVHRLADLAFRCEVPTIVPVPQVRKVVDAALRVYDAEQIADVIRSGEVVAWSVTGLDVALRKRFVQPRRANQQSNVRTYLALAEELDTQEQLA